MLWNILRPRFWELRHQLIETSWRKRILIILGLLVILGFTGGLFVSLVFGLTGPRNKGYLSVLLPTSFFTFFLFMVIQLGDTLQQLYLSPDLFWLNQAPLRKWDIYLAKLVECTFSLWLPILFSLGMLITLGIAQGAPLVYYPLVIMVLFGLLMLATVTGMLVIMALTRIIPPHRLRELFPAVMAVVSISGIFLQRLFFNRFTTNPVNSFQILTTSLQDPWQMALLTVLVSAAAAIWISFGYGVFVLVNENAINAMQWVRAPKTKSPTVSAGSILKQVPFWVNLFPPEQFNIMIKDWTTLRRDPQRATNLVLTPVMMIIFMLPSLGWKDFSASSYWLMLFYGAIFSMSSGQGVALSAFTQEARVFSFIFRSPIKMSSVMLAKFWSAWLPTALLWTVVLGGSALLIHLSFWQWAALNGMVLFCLAGTCFVMVAISARWADLSVISARSRLTGPMAWVGVLVGSSWNFLGLGLTISLIFWLAADSPLVSGLLDSLNLSAVPTYIPILTAAASLTGIVLACIPLGLFWLSGLKRLKNWEQI